MMRIVDRTPYEHIYALDPGDSTGICYIGQLFGNPVFDTCTVTQQELHRFLSVQEIFGKGLLIYEDFVSRASFLSRRQIAPQIIGASRFWGYQKSFHEMRVTPMETHRINRNLLKTAGWKWYTEHELDAIRILVTTLLKIKYAKG